VVKQLQVIPINVLLQGSSTPGRTNRFTQSGAFRRAAARQSRPRMAAPAVHQQPVVSQPLLSPSVPKQLSFLAWVRSCPVLCWLANWQWCLLFGICLSLSGFLLLFLSSMPVGVSVFLVLPGLLYPCYLLRPATRARPFATFFALTGNIAVTLLLFTLLNRFA
jgi:hypothetical protein